MLKLYGKSIAIASRHYFDIFSGAYDGWATEVSKSFSTGVHYKLALFWNFEILIHGYFVTLLLCYFATLLLGYFATL